MLRGDSIYDQPPVVPNGAPVMTATVCSGPGQGQSIALRRAVSLFGTRAGCKFLLRHAAIRPVHCLIVNTGERFMLRDLDSGGRTLLNGLKAEQELLNDGDRLTLGPWDISLDVDSTEIEGHSDSPAVLDLEPDPTVLAVGDPETHKLTRLPRELTILGRSSRADITLPERDVSRVHAVIFRYLNKPVIVDLFSTNGTFVNDRRVSFATLHDGDEVLLGSHTLRFCTNTDANGNDGNGLAAVRTPTPLQREDDTLSDLIKLSGDTIHTEERLGIGD